MSFINWVEIDTPSELISAGTIALTVIIGYIGYFVAYTSRNARSNYKATVDSQNSRISALEQETEACAMNHHESIKQINYLQGQLDTYKSTPIKDTSESLKLIVKSQQSLVKSQIEIVKLLRGGK